MISERTGLQRWFPREASVPLIALLAGAIAISAAPILVRFSGTGPFATAFWRMLLSFPIAWLLALRYGAREPAGAPRGAATLSMAIRAGIFLAGDLGIWHLSLAFTSVANSTLLNNTAPLFTALGAWLFLGQPVHRSFWLAMLLAFVGAVLLLQGSISTGNREMLGNALAVLSAASYSAYLMAVAACRQHMSTATVLMINAAAACATLLPIVLITGEKLWPDTAADWGVLVALALIIQIIGQGLITYALAHLAASFSSLVLVIQPVMAAVYAWVLLAEPLAGTQVLGGMIILAAIALVIWIRRRSTVVIVRAETRIES